MVLVICPGIHPPELTNSFLQALGQVKADSLVFPTEHYAAYSTQDIKRFLTTNLGSPKTSPPITLIAFSAGVVGAFGASKPWQKGGGRVKAFIALDGWGMPLWGDFPIYRLSHDYFTHWSSALLGPGKESFYADPEVEHLELWRSPHKVTGRWLSAPGCRSRSTAKEFLISLLN